MEMDLMAPLYRSPDERAAQGRSVRDQCARDQHANWSPALRAHTPLDLLVEQELTRVPELVAIRHGRMAASPFAYYRGAALPMAADLAALPQTPLHVQLCGDAHLANFGGFASPERELVFDINDFDETAPGPFEWDVKRLGASLEIAGRSRGFGAKECRRIVLNGVGTYREAMREFAAMGKLDIWYAKLGVTEILGRWGQGAGGRALKNFQRGVDKAESKDRLKARDKLTKVVEGELRFLSDPPLLVPVEEIYSDPAEAEIVESSVHGALDTYRETLSSDRRRLLNEYRYVDLARKVVGVGSVGTRCWVAMFVGRDENDPLFLQVKEAEASVLERFTERSELPNHGQRVVDGQRLMQASSDIFLGWHSVVGPDGVTRDFYMRQLWDWKASASIETMDSEALGIYAGISGWTLARAHARTGDEIAIGAYLGGGKAFDHAIADFSSSYAEQNQVDYQALVNAVADGDLIADAGV